MADTRLSSGTHVYALALGSNRPRSARRTPARLIAQAVALIGAEMRVRAVSPVIVTPPLGPSLRRYANDGGEPSGAPCPAAPASGDRSAARPAPASPLGCAQHRYRHHPLVGWEVAGAPADRAARRLSRPRLRVDAAVPHRAGLARSVERPRRSPSARAAGKSETKAGDKRLTIRAAPFRASSTASGVHSSVGRATDF